jgi:hypothetical protein
MMHTDENLNKIMNIHSLVLTSLPIEKNKIPKCSWNIIVVRLHKRMIQDILVLHFKELPTVKKKQF